ASLISRLFSCGLALVACCATAEQAAKSRVWTDAKGRQLDAVFVALDGDSVIIQTADGAPHRIPLASLSPDDQEVAKTSKSMEGALLPANASASTATAKIDQLVNLGLLKHNAVLTKDGKPEIKPNPAATDEQFVRRIYLDVTGRIPSYEETQTFLKSRNPAKRSELINTLLDSDGYVSHMYNYFADMLRVKDQMDNRLLKGLPYIQWLKDNITANTGWDKMSYELMTATGKLWNNGATGYLLRDAGMPLDNLSNTLSVFLGTDVACAQCHDHPFADWTQIQFYQMAAFFGTTSTKMGGRDFGGKDPTKQLTKDMEYLMEKNGMDVKKSGGLVTNILRANEIVVRDLSENRTKLPHDYKYKDAAPNDPVAPKFVTWSKDDEKAPCYKQDLKSGENFRNAFGKWMTDPSNPRFAMTIANRLWARAMGVGLTSTITNIDDPSKASNPELLQHLANEMVRLKFNMKEFQRVIFNSQTYQREATTYEVAMGEPYFFQGPLLRRMSAEQAWDSYMTLVLGEQLDKIKNTQADPYGRAIDIDLEKTTVQTLASKITAIQKLGDLAKKKMAGGGLAKAGKMTADDEDEMDGGKVYQYAGMKLMRSSELEQPAPAGHFLRDFGQSDRHFTDGSAKDGSVPQVLVMMNGKAQQMMTEKDSLMFRNIAKNKSTEDKMEAIFLSILNRRPTMKEKGMLVKDYQKSGEKSFANVIWALINTREFTFIQ
ncbi:MAG: DUF1549 domain-containing protein, partial [Verrucomicrobiaceae bacterium]